MKKVFEAPEMTIVNFSAENIIMVSLGGVGGDRETDIVSNRLP